MVTLSEKARRARNDYQNAYRKKNPEKQQQYITSYWERRAAREEEEERARLGQFFQNKCLECGKELEGMRKGASFCSPACRQKHHREAKG